MDEGAITKGGEGGATEGGATEEGATGGGGEGSGAGGVQTAKASRKQSLELSHLCWFHWLSWEQISFSLVRKCSRGAQASHDWAVFAKHDAVSSLDGKKIMDHWYILLWLC